MKKYDNSFTLGIELIDNPDWIGGTLYLRNLALSLAQLPDDSRPNIHLLGPESVVTNFRNECKTTTLFDAQSGETIWTRIQRKVGWRSNHSKNEIDVVYPGFGIPVPGAVTIRWIPDFQHRYLPDLFSEEEIAARDQSIDTIARSPGVVVLSSETAAEDFSRFFPGHLATPRVWNFHSILDLPEDTRCEEIRKKFNLPEKYFYLPNQFWVHKNHITVFRALAELKHSQGLEIPLVCTGAQTDHRNKPHFDSLLAYLKEHKLTDQVSFLGLLPRSEQIAVLRSSAAVVQPSLFEGWSTVVEDARAAGRPILLSDIAVHQEQAPDGARYFSAESPVQLAQLLAETWPLIQPGPDLKSESEARRNTENLILDSAHTFNKIVHDALRLSIEK